MKRNESSLDRVIRVVIAAAAVGGAVLVGASSIVGIVLLVVAAVMLVTAAIGWCPLYSLFGISSCPMPEQRSANKDKVGAAS
ncbi:MAG: DUF2892 domain-containing protein [Candidatus Nanopelagicales bacterium]